jgi:AcrR family transcriptional regulator
MTEAESEGAGANPPEPGNRKGRDLAGTIATIFHAARLEFREKGFEGAKMEHIARRAKVSKQLVYLYFSSKQELYEELVKAIGRDSFSVLMPIDYEGQDPVSGIRAYVEAVYDYFRDNPEACAVTLDESLHAGIHLRIPKDVREMQVALRDRIGNVLERGQRAGIFSDRFDATALEFMTMTVVTGAISSRHMFEEYIGHPLGQDSDQMRTLAIEFLLAGLRA